MTKKQMLTTAGALTLALGLGLGVGVVAAQDDDHSTPSMTDIMEDGDMDAMHAGMSDDMTAECDSMSGHDSGSMDNGSMDNGSMDNGSMDNGSMDNGSMDNGSMR